MITKDGCGRVYAGTSLHLVHAYTLECGYHSPNTISPIAKLKLNYNKFK